MTRWLDIIQLRLRALARRSGADSELEKELRFHLDQQIQENIAAGMPVAEALYAARRTLGGITQIQEECRDMRRTHFIDDLMADLRYACRALARTPGFAVVIVLTMALSIGANSAIFSVIDGVLLKQLPYPRQDRIMRIFMSSATYPNFTVNRFDFLDFRARNRTFGCMAIMTRSDVQLSSAGEPQRLTAFEVSAGYFRVLGIHPARGREFTTRDELKGSPHIAILSDRLWRTRFGADPEIIGRKIVLDGLPFQVVGLMPPEMQHPGNMYRPTPYGGAVDVWSPFTFEGDPNERGTHYSEGIGRLKDGVSMQQASADLNAVLAQIAREHPNSGYEGWHVLVIPLYQEIVGASQKLLLILLGAVGLVLLIACANAANLLLARATARQREMAMRSALGASGWRLIRQMLTESAVMALIGGAAGALLAVFGVKVLVSLLPLGFPRGQEIHMNLAVFAFALIAALATGILFGLAPALQAARTDLQQNLRSGQGATGSSRHLSLRNWLVVGEVSLACVLLIGAGLMLRSFVNLLRTDPGFRPQHVLTAGISLPDETYKTPQSMLGFYDEFLRRVRLLPGVRAAGLGSDLPWTGYDDNTGGFDIEGKKPPPHEQFHARYHMASPGYFRAVGMPLAGGRFFRDGDKMKAPLVLIINRAMAQRYWPGEDAVGKRINFFHDLPKESDWTTIVGVVGDVKDTPEKRAAEPAFWWPLAQAPFFTPGVILALRSTSDAAALTGSVRRTLRELDPTLALADVRLLERIADAGVSTPRFALFLVGLFAVLAITLAAVGIYGVISYSVSERTREFGMRVALGAKPYDVLTLVLSQGLKFALAGVAGGLLCSLALARVLRTLLYEVSAVDPMTFALVSVAALAIAVLACYLPARRATYADPMTALRAE